MKQLIHRFGSYLLLFSIVVDFFVFLTISSFYLTISSIFSAEGVEVHCG